MGERVTAAPVTGRLAPSPTGRMHLGNAYAALAAWLGARAAGGRVLLRIEDIDAPRVVKDADRWIMDDLTWLGLDWDGDAVYQSQRLDAYEEALRRLREMTWDGDALGCDPTRCGEGSAAYPLIYPCFCSRADIRAASAPNEGDGFLIYPGTCRRLPESERRERIARGNRHSWRIAVPDANAPESERVMRFDDRVFGPQRFDLPRQLGDVPLIDAADGRRMAKRLNSLDLGAMRERGDDPRAVIGYCAWLLRLVDEPRPMTPQELLPLFSWDAVAADPADRVVDADTLLN